eukprot:8629010-Prorocentrum_lima.AAC.1
MADRSTAIPVQVRSETGDIGCHWLKLRWSRLIQATSSGAGLAGPAPVEFAERRGAYRIR